jgi:NADPH-dependent curcumin reductase CurA
MEHVSNLHLLNGINNMKLNGRIGLCGVMKSYTSQIAHGPNLLNVITNNINIKGYVVGRHYNMWDQFQEYILDKYDSFEFKQHIEHGLDKVPSIYDNLYNSYGKGKLVIKI